ncbi:MAG TPA: sigma-70 family RNA polymerase sigma factor [Myxococcales bacterium]|nr:sigma-70 family RNA polymerase sigma factor [Myxococcales bacterium]
MRTPSEFETVSKYLDGLKGFPPLTREAEHELALRVKKGEESARELLVRHNLPFVVSVSRKYLGRGARLDDLIQEGNIGLLKAVEHFDPHKGTRFSTYAIWWIRAYIQKYLRDIRSSVRGGDSEGRVYQRDLSLDASLDEEGDVSHLDLLESDLPGPEQTALAKERDEDVNAALGRLRKRLGDLGWDIVNERLKQESPKTLEELGKRFGVSRERVRQVELRTRAFLARYLASFAPTAG